MLTAIIIAALGLPLAAWALWRAYSGWSPGIGSQAPGAQFLTPPAATTTSASSGNVAAATATATLAAVAGKTNFIEGFDFTFTGATAGAAVTVTVTGLVGGTLSFTTASATGVAAAGSLSIRFPTPLQATGQNVAIAVSAPSLGAGNTNATMTAYGLLV